MVQLPVGNREGELPNNVGGEPFPPLAERFEKRHHKQLTFPRHHLIVPLLLGCLRPCGVDGVVGANRDVERGEQRLPRGGREGGDAILEE